MENLIIAKNLTKKFGKTFSHNSSKFIAPNNVIASADTVHSMWHPDNSPEPDHIEYRFLGHIRNSELV